MQEHRPEDQREAECPAWLLGRSADQVDQPGTAQRRPRPVTGGEHGADDERLGAVLGLTEVRCCRAVHVRHALEHLERQPRDRTDDEPVERAAHHLRGEPDQQHDGQHLDDLLRPRGGQAGAPGLHEVEADRLGQDRPEGVVVDAPPSRRWTPARRTGTRRPSPWPGSTSSGRAGRTATGTAARTAAYQANPCANDSV